MNSKSLLSYNEMISDQQRFLDKGMFSCCEFLAVRSVICSLETSCVAGQVMNCTTLNY